MPKSWIPRPWKIRNRVKDRAVLILAAWVGKTRLIDNGFLEGNPDSSRLRESGSSITSSPG